MAIHFQVKDPRGRLVTCDEDCWYKHILAKRPQMDGWEDRVKETISEPDPPVIYQHPTKSNRNIYYRRQRNASYMLKVVVEFTERGKGYVRTAHPTDSGKTGEVMVWPQSKD